MNKQKCDHDPVQIGDERRYFTSVAVPPYTDENRAAHGGITITQECTLCGARRAVNINGHHDEYGPWGPDKAAREAAEKEAAQNKKKQNEDIARAAARKAGISVLSVHRMRGGDSRYVTLQMSSGQKECSIEDIEAAANQYDNGDGLVQVYAGVLLMAREMPTR